MQSYNDVLTKAKTETIITSREGVIFMANTNVTMRMDENLKFQLQELMSDLGLDLTTFFTMAAKQAIREQGIPFHVAREIPKKETIEAFQEVEEMKKHPENINAYSSFAELLGEVEQDV